MCKYCEPKITRELIAYDDLDVAILQNKLVVWFRIMGTDFTFTEPINYCPKCGRKLNEAE